MITLLVTHEADAHRAGGWFVVSCPERGPLVPYGDGAVRRSDRRSALRAARVALLERLTEQVRRGQPLIFERVWVVDMTANAPESVGAQGIA